MLCFIAGVETLLYFQKMANLLIPGRGTLNAGWAAQEVPPCPFHVSSVSHPASLVGGCQGMPDGEGGVERQERTCRLCPRKWQWSQCRLPVPSGSLPPKGRL